MEQLSFFTGHTLVDITPTGVVRPSNEKIRNQQRNWETVLQVIGLRTQPMLIDEPVCVTHDLEYYKFGNMFAGKQNIWLFNFAVEHLDIYGDDAEILEDDFNQTPFTVGLTETVGFLLPVFYTSGAIKNIYFTKGRLDLNNI